jgi:flagellar biosynthesis regulator FlaF
LVARGEASFDTLIEVNRAIMQGLATQAEAA